MSDEHVWTYDYENHGNGAFWEWWNILRDGDKIGTVTTSEDDAKMTCTLLNAAEMLSAEDAEELATFAGFALLDVPEKARSSSVARRIGALKAYADAREGKKT